MDGLVETSGRIIICTANDPSKISEAFKRPGRLDEHIEFTKCTKEMISQLLGLFYGTTTMSDEQLEKMKKLENLENLEKPEKLNDIENNIDLKYSPAEINKICFNHLDSIDDAIDVICG
jgi:SpoVK/Ycf46/Vps4 family AAA+-type ATPase